MRLVPLLPILHRLGAIQHFSRAHGGAPSFAERPGTITYAELTTSDWTTDPPTRTPIYSPDMHVPPPPDTAPADEVERILVADMPPPRPAAVWACWQRCRSPRLTLLHHVRNGRELSSCYDEHWCTLHTSIRGRRARADFSSGARHLPRARRIYSAPCRPSPDASYDARRLRCCPYQLRYLRCRALRCADLLLPLCYTISHVVCAVFYS